MHDRIGQLVEIAGVALIILSAFFGCQGITLNSALSYMPDNNNLQPPMITDSQRRHEYQLLDWSPDGKQIAFKYLSYDESWGIYNFAHVFLVSIDSSVAEVSFQTSDEFNDDDPIQGLVPTWASTEGKSALVSPAGKKQVYISSQTEWITHDGESSGDLRISIKDVATGQERRLYPYVLLESFQCSYWVAGDESPSITAVFSNATDATLTVPLEFWAPTLDFQSDNQNVTLSPGEETQVVWNVTPKASYEPLTTDEYLESRIKSGFESGDYPVRLTITSPLVTVNKDVRRCIVGAVLRPPSWITPLQLAVLSLSTLVLGIAASRRLLRICVEKLTAGRVWLMVLLGLLALFVLVVCILTLIGPPIISNVIRSTYF